MPPRGGEVSNEKQDSALFRERNNSLLLFPNTTVTERTVHHAGSVDTANNNNKAFQHHLARLVLLESNDDDDSKSHFLDDSINTKNVIEVRSLIKKAREIHDKISNLDIESSVLLDACYVSIEDIILSISDQAALYLTKLTGGNENQLDLMMLSSVISSNMFRSFRLLESIETLVSKPKEEFFILEKWFRQQKDVDPEYIIQMSTFAFPCLAFELKNNFDSLNHSTTTNDSGGEKENLPIVNSLQKDHLYVDVKPIIFVRAKDILKTNGEMEIESLKSCKVEIDSFSYKPFGYTCVSGITGEATIRLRVSSNGNNNNNHKKKETIWNRQSENDIQNYSIMEARAIQDNAAKQNKMQTMLDMYVSSNCGGCGLNVTLKVKTYATQNNNDVPRMHLQLVLDPPPLNH